MSTLPRRSRYLWLAVCVAILYLALYLYEYHYSPFNDFWNVFVIDAMLVISAVAGAVLATLLRFEYHADDQPRAIWTSFALALWLWVLAEVYWMVYNITLGDVPGFTFADVLWLAGYLFIINAVRVQYRIIFRPTRRLEWLLTAGLLVTITFVTFLALWLAVPNIGLDDVFVYLYPVIDFFVGLCVLYLLVLFWRAALIFPWLSLFAFLVADSIYIWVYESGLYAFFAQERSIFSLLADITYLVAYLIFALGCLAQYLVYKLQSTAKIAKPKS